MRPLARAWPALLVIVLALLVALSGRELAQRENSLRERQLQQQLLSIATLQARLFATWQYERMADAQILADNRLLAEQVEAFLAQPDTVTRPPEAIARHLHSLRTHYHYEDILILDRAGHIRHSLIGQGEGERAIPLSLLDASRMSGQAQLSGFRPASVGGDQLIASIAPLSSTGGADGSGRLSGYILLQSSLENSILPLLDPIGTPSTRSFLIRQEGDRLHVFGRPGLSAQDKLEHRIPLATAGLERLPGNGEAMSLTLMPNELISRPTRAVIAATSGTDWKILTVGDDPEGDAGSPLQFYAGSAAAILLFIALIGLLLRPPVVDETPARPRPVPPQPPEAEPPSASAEPARTPRPSSPAPESTLPPPEDALPLRSIPSAPPAGDVQPTPPPTDPGIRTLAELGEQPGIDLAAGLRVVGGREIRYLELLHRYLDHHGALPMQIADALAARDQALAQRLAHTLKGASGTLGLTMTQAAARALEMAIRDQAEAELSDRLETLARVHEAQCALIAQLALPDNLPPAEPTTAPSVLTDAQLQQLRWLLTEDDMRSNAYALELQGPLGVLLGEDAETFRRHLDHYDYPAALALLPARMVPPGEN